jgi:hypothetical protein
LSGVLRKLTWQTERKKYGNRARAHGGQIAQASCQGAMSNRFRRMPFEAKVAAADRKVGGHSKFFAGTSAKQGAVVSYSKAQAPAGPGFNSRLCALAQLADDHALGRVSRI